MKAFKILSKKNKHNQLYQEINWEGTILPQDVILIGPPEYLRSPKFNLEKRIWEEDSESMIEKLLVENEELKTQLLNTQMAILDIYREVTND